MSDIPLHAPSATFFARDLSATPRPASFVRKALEKERLAIVTGTLYFLLFPAIAWIVLARGLRVSPFGVLAAAGGIALAALWHLLGDVRALRVATRLLRDGVGVRGRVVGRLGFLIDVAFPGVDGSPTRAVFLPTLRRNEGESVAVIHVPERDELLAITERGVVAGVRRRVSSPAPPVT